MIWGARALACWLRRLAETVFNSAFRCCPANAKSSAVAHRYARKLLQGDFTHGFGAEDFADVESLYRRGAALIFGAHHLLNDRVHLVAQTVQRSHIRVLHHDEDAEVLRGGGVAVQDSVVENDFLLFFLFVNRLHWAADRLEIIIAQSGLCLDHG